MRRALSLLLLLAWTAGPWVRPLPEAGAAPSCGCSMMAGACPLGASGKLGCCTGHGGVCSLRQQPDPGQSEVPGAWSPQMRWGLTPGFELGVSPPAGPRLVAHADRLPRHEPPTPPKPPPRRSLKA
jgi:hypothetical protein